VSVKLNSGTFDREGLMIEPATVFLIAGIVAPIGSSEKKATQFLQAIRPRCVSEGCEIHLAASTRLVAGITAPPEMGDDRIQSLRQFLGDLCACAGFVIHLGKSTVPATTAMDRESKAVSFSMTVRLAGMFSDIQSHLNDLEPNGTWEGDDVTPRFRTYRGAVATYHSTTQSLQFQGNNAAAIALRTRFLARIGRAD
jgi:hypothetical protein